MKTVYRFEDEGDAVIDVIERQAASDMEYITIKIGGETRYVGRETLVAVLARLDELDEQYGTEGIDPEWPEMPDDDDTGRGFAVEDQECRCYACKRRDE